MEIKFVEIRDEGTCIPALAMRTRASGRVASAFLHRCGYSDLGVILMRLSDQRATSDPYWWGPNDRTHAAAHMWLYEHWDEHVDGAVLDVRVILGEADEPARPEVMT